jgi:hypothetical protein
MLTLLFGMAVGTALGIWKRDHIVGAASKTVEKAASLLQKVK